MRPKKIVDPSNFTEHKDRFGLLTAAVQDEYSPDALGGKTTFTAVVLESHVDINAPMFESVGKKASTPKGQFKFRAQIIDEPSPHAIYPDMLDPDLVPKDKRRAQREKIKQFTEFYSTEMSSYKAPKKGDKVKVELRYNVHGYNLFQGEYLGPVETSGFSGNGYRTGQGSGLASLFGRGTTVPSVAGEGGCGATEGDPGYCSWSGCTKQYIATWNSSAYPQWNGTELRNGDLEKTGMLIKDAKSGAQLIPPAMEDFLKLAAAFEAKFPGKTLRGSGYRSYAGQVYQRMRRNANKCGSGSKTASGASIGVAATPGRSNHGWGAAVDLKSMGSTSTQYFKWVNKFSKNFNFVFGVSDEHWHIDWMNFGTQVGGVVRTPQRSWTTAGQSDVSITLA